MLVRFEKGAFFVCVVFSVDFRFAYNGEAVNRVKILPRGRRRQGSSLGADDSFFSFSMERHRFI
jgi:hypothetical protein